MKKKKNEHFQIMTNREAYEKKIFSDGLSLACEHFTLNAKQVDDFKRRPEGGCEQQIAHIQIQK